MQYSVRVITFFCIFLTNVNGLHVTQLVKLRTCDSKHVWDVSNNALYNRAYKWAKQSDSALQNWHSEKTYEDQFKTKQIVKLHYETNVIVPSFFRLYLQEHKHSIYVHKTVLRQNSLQMAENTIINNLPVIGEITLHSLFQANTTHLQAHIDYELQIPIYLKLIESLIVQHIDQSLKKYAEIVIDSFCESNEH